MHGFLTHCLLLLIETLCSHCVHLLLQNGTPCLGLPFRLPWCCFFVYFGVLDNWYFWFGFEPHHVFLLLLFALNTARCDGWCITLVGVCIVCSHGICTVSPHWIPTCTPLPLDPQTVTHHVSFSCDQHWSAEEHLLCCTIPVLCELPSWDSPHTFLTLYVLDGWSTMPLCASLCWLMMDLSDCGMRHDCWSLTPGVCIEKFVFLPSPYLFV